MKKIKFFACLLLLLLSIQASIFITPSQAESNTIILDAEQSNFDYFGDSYTIEFESGYKRVGFVDEVSLSELSFFVYAQKSAELYLNLYSNQTKSDIVSLNLKSGTARKVVFSSIDLDEIEGIEFNGDFSCIVVGGFNKRFNFSECTLPVIDICAQSNYCENFIEFDLSFPSFYPIKNFEILPSASFEIDENVVIAQRGEIDYELQVRVEDIYGNYKLINLPVLAKNKQSATFSFDGATTFGKGDSFDFYGGGKEYNLNCNSATGITFDLFIKGEDKVFLFTSDNYLTLYPNVFYKISLPSSYLLLESAKEFQFIVTDFYNCSISFSSQSICKDAFKFQDFVFPYVVAPYISEIGIWSLLPISFSGGSLACSYEYLGQKVDGFDLNATKEGSYKVIYSVENNSIKSTHVYTYNLKDSTPPQISADEEITVEFGDKVDLSEISVQDLSGCEYEVEIMDEDELLTFDKDTFLEVGSYKIVITAKDHSSMQNVAKRRVSLKVYDSVAPTLSEIICENEIEVGSECEISYTASDLSPYDCYTGYFYEGLVYTIDSVFIPDRVGEYELFVRCEDSYKNVSEKRKIIQVIDCTPPCITLDKELKFDSENFMSFSDIKISDNYDEFLSIEISATYNDSPVEIIGNGIFYQGYGEYVIKIRAIDSSLNATEKEWTVNLVQEIELPENIEEEFHFRESGLFGCNGSNVYAIFSLLFIVPIKFFRRK